MFTFKILTVWAGAIFVLPFCEGYEFVATESRLPEKLASPSVVYDGQDSIYVIGAYYGNGSNTVYKYSISTGAVEIAGKTAQTLMNGRAVMQGSDILYIGGYDNTAPQWKQAQSTVYRFSTLNGTMTLDGHLPKPVCCFALGWDFTQGVAHVFGGWSQGQQSDDVQRYNPTAKAAKVLAGKLETPSWPNGVWDQENDVYYILGPHYNTTARTSFADIQRFDPREGSSSATLGLNMPYDVSGPCFLFADEDAYMLNGKTPHRFTPATGKAEEIQVNNWPANNITSAGCVYVPKLQRIYMFGAWEPDFVGMGTKTTDRIFYVDLGDSSQPTTTTTTTTVATPTQPKLNIANARLPTPMRSHEAVFDGDDSIYIIGGEASEGVRQDKVLKYSVLADTVETHGKFKALALGAAAMDLADQSILYFGGQGNAGRSSFVYKYSIAGKNYSSVARLPEPTQGAAVAWDASRRSAYLFGGNTAKGNLSQVLQFNTSDNTVTKIGQLPEKRVEAAAGWDAEAGTAYLFGGQGASDVMRSEVLHFNPANRATAKLPTPLPYRTIYPCAAAGTTGDFYAFGGGALLKFNRATQTSEAVEVEGWPASLIMATCAHVPKLSRLYIIGGYGRWTDVESVDSYRNEIAYVHL